MDLNNEAIKYIHQAIAFAQEIRGMMQAFHRELSPAQEKMGKVQRS